MYSLFTSVPICALLVNVLFSYGLVRKRITWRFSGEKDAGEIRVDTVSCSRSVDLLSRRVLSVLEDLDVTTFPTHTIVAGET